MRAHQRRETRLAPLGSSAWGLGGSWLGGSWLGGSWLGGTGLRLGSSGPRGDLLSRVLGRRCFFGGTGLGGYTGIGLLWSVAQGSLTRGAQSTRPCLVHCDTSPRGCVMLTG